MEKRLSIGFKMKITPIKPINDEMTLCKCYVMALGKNLNRSNISQAATDDALPTLFNIPVVGHMFVDDDGNCRMGGHEVEIVKDVNGKYHFKVLTVPYGTVPIQDDVHYEEIEEKDGSKNTYLVADIILWTGRYPELLETKYDDGIYFNQSMEIKPLETSLSTDGFTNVEKFKYSALCLLGKDDDSTKNVAPCFPSSRVEPYKFAFTDEWNKLFEEFKNKLAGSYESVQNLEKGGGKVLNKKIIDNILSEFGIKNIENLNFEITDKMTEDELRLRIKEIFEANDNNQSEGDVGSEDSIKTNEENLSGDDQEEKFQFEMSYETKRKKICNAVDSLCVWSDKFYKSYWLCDFDNKFVYVGYHIAIENTIDSGYGRYAYDAQESDLSLNDESFEKVSIMWLTDEEAKKLESERNEYSELVGYKNKRVEEDRKQSYAAIISEFSDLSELEEYKATVGNAMNFSSIEELKEKLFAIRGKNGAYKTKFSLENFKLPIDLSKYQGENDEVTQFFGKYLPEANKK